MKCLIWATAAYAMQLEADDPKNRPISRVVTLLKDMQKTLIKEGEEDKELYEKMQCWCTTNDKEKTAAIKAAEQEIDRLQNKIEELTGKAARLTTEIENLREEIKENEEALDKATKLRAKQNAEFVQTEKDLVQAIAQLKRAIEVLSKHHESLIQESTLVDIASFLHRQMDLHEELFAETMTSHQREVLNAFVQAPAYKSYNSRSGEIFGILRQMDEEFVKNLADARKEEATQLAQFEELKAAKLAQIAASTKQADKKEVELADTNEEKAESEQLLEDTRNSLSADEKYLMNLKQKCTLTDKEMEEREHTRAEEIIAINRAIEVLASDDARDTFSSTFNNFLQLSTNQKNAVTALEKAAKIRNNPRIAALAAKAKLDAFVKVKEAIDGMIAKLKQEKEDEVAHKDWCDRELRNNDKMTRNNVRNTKDSQTELDRLNTHIASLTEIINTLAKEIQETEVSIKHAGEDREKENITFQRVISEQRDTQRLLKKAMWLLNGFYNKDKVQGKAATEVLGAATPSAFIQIHGQPGTKFDTDAPAGSPPPKSFTKYKNNAQSGGVINLIQQILDDAKAMEKETTVAEHDAQAAYESFVIESNLVIKAKTKEKVNAEADRAQAEIDLCEEKNNMAGLVTGRQQLDSEREATHKSCDYVLRNFEVRQDARDEEMVALRNAKDILSGANFKKFLQRN